jgi:hypothetical protein
MRRSTPAITWLAPVWLGLSACGGGGNDSDVEQTLVFADRSDAEIARLISAAGGTDMFSAQSQLDQYGDTFDPVDPCPGVAIAGDTATITGGCTTADGVEIQGTATVSNPASWDQIEWNPTRDSHYDLDGLAFVQVGYTVSYDGAFEVGNDFQSWDADLVATQLELGVRSDIHYRCTTSACSLTDSGLELVGVGGAHVSGSVRISGTASASYTLTGVDTLVATVESGCVAWRIEGTGREMTCP